jgi:hypothetical protein
MVLDRRVLACAALALLASCAGKDGGGLQASGAGGGGGSDAGGSAGSEGGAGGSAGAEGGAGGAGGSQMPSTDGGSECGARHLELTRRTADILLLLDRSASMQDDAAGNTPAPPADPSKWSQVVPAVMTSVMQTQALVSWGLKTFPEDGAECASETVTNKIDVPVAAVNASAVNAAVVATTPVGNGTPTAGAINVAVAYLQSLSDGNPKYLLLATDGEPTCTAAGSSNVATAGSDAITAVTSAAASGIHTFVLGVATTRVSDTAVLNSLAVAGGEAQPSTNPLATKFYLASDQTDLANAIKAITALTVTCSFALSPPLAAPDLVTVNVAGTSAPRDPNHVEGWDYSDATDTTIEVYGTWCDMITSGSNTIEIVFGC